MSTFFAKIISSTVTNLVPAKSVTIISEPFEYTFMQASLKVKRRKVMYTRLNDLVRNKTINNNDLLTPLAK